MPVTSPVRPQNKQQARTAATRRDLLSAAEKIFVRDGFERAQIETIAAEVGRTKGAVYAHFQGKEDLFFALLETKVNPRVEMFKKLPANAPHERRISIARKVFIESFQQDHNWPILALEFRLFALRNGASKERIRDLYQLLYADVTQSLLGDEGKTKEADRTRLLVALSVLRVLPSALALEKQFNPVLETPGVLKQVLETIFDCLLTENKTVGRVRVKSGTALK